MLVSQRSVSSAHSLHRRPNRSSGATTRPEDAQGRVIEERVPCSGLRPPRYPKRPSKWRQSQYPVDQRSTTKRRREISTADAVVPSDTQKPHLPCQARVQQGRGYDTVEVEEVPSRPLQRTHAHSACHNGYPANRMKAGSAKDTLKREGVYERWEGEMESAALVAPERERQRHLEEEFSLRLSVWKAEAERRNRREEGTEQDTQEFERSGVYTRERHQRHQYWAATKAWRNIRGFADIAVVGKQPLGIWERLHFAAARNSYR